MKIFCMNKISIPLYLECQVIQYDSLKCGISGSSIRIDSWIYKEWEGPDVKIYPEKDVEMI
jgi:hypothetical protein